MARQCRAACFAIWMSKRRAQAIVQLQYRYPRSLASRARASPQSTAWSLPRPRGLLPAEHVYATAQFELPTTLANSPTPLALMARLPLRRRTSSIEVAGEGICGRVSVRTAACCLRLCWFRQELLLTPLTPNFWRAPTDNDFGNYMPDWAAVWEQAGRNRSLHGARACSSSAKDQCGDRREVRVSRTIAGDERRKLER